MKSALAAAVALTTLAIFAPISAAHAGNGMTIRVETPEFGIRIGTPVRIYAPAPVYVPPAAVYVPAPVYLPPAPVVYVPPRVVVQPRVVYPIAHPYAYGPGARHWKNKKKHFHRERGWVYAPGY